MFCPLCDRSCQKGMLGVDGDSELVEMCAAWDNYKHRCSLWHGALLVPGRVEDLSDNVQRLCDIEAGRLECDQAVSKRFSKEDD